MCAIICILQTLALCGIIIATDSKPTKSLIKTLDTLKTIIQIPEHFFESSLENLWKFKTASMSMQKSGYF